MKWAHFHEEVTLRILLVIYIYCSATGSSIVDESKLKDENGRCVFNVEVA
jgi:hypothetical protein